MWGCAKENAPDAVIIIVGNKIDLGSRCRKVTTEEGEALAAELDCDFYIETSAVKGMNVDNAFKGVYDQLYYIRPRPSPSMRADVVVDLENDVQDVQESGCWC